MGEKEDGARKRKHRPRSPGLQVAGQVEWRPLRGGLIRDSPKPRDALWQSMDPYDKAKYRTLGNTVSRDSYIIDCTAVSDSRSWRLHFAKANGQDTAMRSTVVGTPAAPAISRFPCIPTQIATVGSKTVRYS